MINGVELKWNFMMNAKTHSHAVSKWNFPPGTANYVKEVHYYNR